MVLRFVRRITALLDGLHPYSKQSGAKPSEFNSLCLPLDCGHLACAGVASVSGECLARGPAEISCLPGKFKANFPSDVGVVQEVQRSEPERW